MDAARDFGMTLAPPTDNDGLAPHLGNTITIRPPSSDRTQAGLGHEHAFHWVCFLTAYTTGVLLLYS